MAKRKAITGLARFVSETTTSTSTTPANLAQEFNEGINGLDSRPQKKTKLQHGLLGSELVKYDATGLVPFYTDASEVPPHLQKYFSQRERYFSLYSQGCLLDEEGWYSVTPEAIANQIAERCRCDVVLDAFCGVGGNAIAFARTCERVIALDVSPVRLALARHNAALYGVQDRIEFILGDFFSFARTLKDRPGRKIDVVFLSPPWGGPSYLSSSPKKSKNGTYACSDDAPVVDAEETYEDFRLCNIRPVDGAELFTVARGITKNIAYFLPRNTDMHEISRLVADNSEMVEVEEEWMGSKLKALTCYFGGLVAGQEAMFGH